MTFRWRPFANPARKDGLELSHWVKCFKDAQGNVSPADGGEYVFAKYNKKVEGGSFWWWASVGANGIALRGAGRGRLPMCARACLSGMDLWHPCKVTRRSSPAHLDQERVLRYNDEEWEQIVTQEPSWSREESDYLLDLAEQLDLRWLVIADRYEVRGCFLVAARRASACVHSLVWSWVPSSRGVGDG